MRKGLVVVALVVAGVAVAGCAPVFYVRAVSADGKVVCQASNGGVRTYHATGSQLRSIRIGDRCPN